MRDVCFSCVCVSACYSAIVKLSIYTVVHTIVYPLFPMSCFQEDIVRFADSVTLTLQRPVLYPIKLALSNTLLFGGSVLCQKSHNSLYFTGHY